MDLRWQPILRQSLSHYEGYVTPNVGGRITLLLAFQAQVDQAVLHADLTFMQQTFKREVGNHIVPGCSFHGDFVTPAGVRACAAMIEEVLAEVPGGGQQGSWVK